jgi:hypothetical protein
MVSLYSIFKSLFRFWIFVLQSALQNFCYFSIRLFINFLLLHFGVGSFNGRRLQGLLRRPELRIQLRTLRALTAWIVLCCMRTYCLTRLTMRIAIPLKKKKLAWCIWSCFKFSTFHALSLCNGRGFWASKDREKWEKQIKCIHKRILYFVLHNWMEIFWVFSLVILVKNVK